MLNISYSKTITVEPLEGALQSAVDNASDGDILSLQSGEYLSKKAITISSKKNLTLMAEGDVWIICDDVNEPVIRIKESSANITLKNIKAKHKEPLKEYSCHGAVVSIDSSKNIKIINCELNGCGAMGVEMYKSSSVEIDQCYVHQNSWVAFYISQSTDVKITNNKIENNKSLIQLSRVNFLEMWGNEIKNNKGYN